MNVQLHFLDPKRERGHVRATVKAIRSDDSVAFADTVKLDSSEDRRRFVRELSDRLNGDSPGLAVLEDKLLGVFVQVSGDLEEAGSERDKPQSQATMLVELARSAELFHDRFGESFASVPIGGHHETWPVQSKGFRDWLARLFYAKQNGAPTSQALADAAAVLRGRALFDGPEKTVHVRIAELGGAIYLDTGNDDWEAIEVTPNGWRPITKPPVKFKRTRGMLALPRPEPGGSVDLLKPYLNIKDLNDWRLALSWLIQALRPTGPFPVLTLHGEQGSAKSTASRVLRALVDLNAAPIRSLPREERDLVIAASNGWVVAFDNVSRIPDWLSDGLCRLATGGGFSTRALHTDSEEMLFDATRPILLNAIEDVALRGDLQNRALTLYLPNLTRQSRKAETSFWTAFEQDRPKILGALLDAVALALKEFPTVTLAELPRMADFALWSAAAAPKLGWTASRFTAAYNDNIRSTESLPLDASPLAKPIRDLLDLASGHPFNGTAGELLEILNGQADSALLRLKTWPKDATRLAGELRRLAPYFRAEGIEIQFVRTGAKRTLKIYRHPDEPLPPDDAGSDAGSDAEHHDSVISVTPEASDYVQSDADDASDAGSPPCSFSISAHDEENPSTTKVVSGGAREEDEQAGKTASSASLASLSYEAVSETARLREVLPELIAAKVLGFDVETTGLNPHNARIRLAQFATVERVVLVDCFAVDQQVLAPIFDGGRMLVGHNLDFELRFLASSGLPIPDGSRLFDTMRAAQVLAAGTADFYLNKNGLAAVCKRFLGIDLDKEQQKSDWTGELSEAQLQYAAKDAAIVLPIARAQRDALKAANLETVAALEMRALPAVAWLIHTGAPFDAQQWRALSDKATEEQILLEQEMTEIAGQKDLLGDSTINWSSPKQVEQLLIQRGHAIRGTDETTLKELEAVEPLAGLMLRYRDASKRVSSFGVEYLKYVDQTTGRIHAGFDLLGSAAGRMSCGKPNLQQVPHDKRYRACFKPADDNVLVVADYSQIELRIAAEITSDPRMLAAYRQGEDLHTLTAATVLGRPNGDVRPEDRQAAKALNFGLIYGMGANSLRQHAADNYGVTLTQKQAESFKEKFFRNYSGLKRWHNAQKAGAIETRTLSGRRRLEVSSFTWKVNTPVQGTGADGLKAALALMWETRETCPTAKPVLVVHDEIVVEVPAADAEQAKEWVVECMTRGMSRYLSKVPVVVEAKVVSDWSGK